MRFFFFILGTVLILSVTATHATQSTPAPRPITAQPEGIRAYKIPDPDETNNMIVEFANAIEGTDGTPESIGRKAKGRAPAGNEKPRKRAEAQDMPVMGF